MLAEHQVPIPPWCLEYWPGGYTMAKLAHENRVMAAHAHGGGTTVVLCHAAFATSAHDCLGGATAALCPEGHTMTAYMYVACITVAPYH